MVVVAKLFCFHGGQRYGKPAQTAFETRSTPPPMSPPCPSPPTKPPHLSRTQPPVPSPHLVVNHAAAGKAIVDTTSFMALAKCDGRHACQGLTILNSSTLHAHLTYTFPFSAPSSCSSLPYNQIMLACGPRSFSKPSRFGVRRTQRLKASPRCVIARPHSQ